MNTLIYMTCTNLWMDGLFWSQPMNNHDINHSANENSAIMNNRRLTDGNESKREKRAINMILQQIGSDPYTASDSDTTYHR